ncbi:tRNA (adenosine(37)-N6)-threonylcarbamoyltransferase complex ATPase subunit type 1 TsaE [Flavitalea sp.]|nr:tRNA (adenosine(37)-N6)-threonylcarbamoyltransferase complex ATPase subunit type 1 TsaE [Flavitalea sp.]
MELIFTLEEIENAAQKFRQTFKDDKVFAFHGNMGTGKTTFITAICRSLGVEGPVSSPTFSIINEYNARGCTIYHLDLYRLKNSDEAVEAGVEDVLYSGEICLVEWPERAPGIFPDNTVNVFLELIDPSTRKLIVT